MGTSNVWQLAILLLKHLELPRITHSLRSDCRAPSGSLVEIWEITLDDNHREDGDN